MDNSVYELIEQLKEVLEAPSIGEVVRQAVRAYAIKLALCGSVDNHVYITDDPKSAMLKKLNVRIPNRTKKRLEVLKDLTGETYTDIILSGIGLLDGAAKESERLLMSLENGEFKSENFHKDKGTSKSSDVDVFDLNNAKVLNAHV